GITLRNLTPAASGAVSLEMDFDPELEFVSANVEPFTLSGNTISWELPELGGWAARNLSVMFLVPADVGLLGTQLVTTAQVSTANTDGNLDNNVDTWFTTITGSY